MSQNKIHPTAIIEDGAQIGLNCEIGPYCVIGKGVRMGDGNILSSHVIITGNTIIGSDNRFYSFASIGQIPQDKKYHGENSKLIIGSGNIFREYVTANIGTENGGMETRIGDNCLFMASSHIAHDCIIGNEVILANSVALAGHVTVGDFAIIGGLSAVHQFTKIGEYSMIGGMSPIAEDVIPFGIAMGERANLVGINLVGMKRRNFSKEDIAAIKEAYEIIFNNKSHHNFAERVEQVSQNFSEFEAVKIVVDFIKSENSRSICKPK